MKTLTIIINLFVPITFANGFFRMNFFEPIAHLIGWTGKQMSIVVLGIMIALPTVMHTWIRRRTWVQKLQ